MTDDVIAQAADGRVRGARDGHALRFLGIPYAQSPAEAGRFAAPVPPRRWDGIRDALAYGATSPQPDRGITMIPEPVIAGDNELNLNVFTPDLGAAGLPVLLWIHGGGFFGGGNASPWYHGGSFARDGVILVSINYRLGAQGFLEVPGAPANRAVRDWVRALEWVQDNIAAFGGDPGQVTIAGQSAGGSACAALLGVPAARGLFRRAVCMSGGAALRQSADGVRAVAAQMAGCLGVPALNQAALAELPVETILAAQQAVAGARDGREGSDAIIGLLSSGIRLPWAPWTDGEVITEEPLQAAASPQHRGISVLAGATANEFTMRWMTAGWITAGMVTEGLAQAGVPAPLAASYLGRAGRPCVAVGQAITDRTFRVPAQQLAAAKAEAGGRAYTYDFRWPTTVAPLAGLAFHCLDVPFAFDTLGAPGVREATGPAPPASLATQMHRAWVRFVTDGDPGWEAYQTARRPVMVFAEPSAVHEDPLAAERAAWG
ncbi:MAG: carboxylesterase family protein [Streptosporangiaceae bacterium]|jgi:para-nitrobenzyl esterase